MPIDFLQVAEENLALFGRQFLAQFSDVARFEYPRILAKIGKNTEPFVNFFVNLDHPRKEKFYDFPSKLFTCPST